MKISVPWRYRLISWLIAPLFIGTTLVSFLLHRVISKKAAFVGDDLYIEGTRAAPETIEKLFVRVYWPYADFAVKHRNRRRAKLWPEGRWDIFGAKLRAWANAHGVLFKFEGSEWAIQAMEKRFNDPL